MKLIILGLLLSIVFSCRPTYQMAYQSSNKLKNVGDTAQYLEENILRYKQKYIHQPLENLLNDLRLNVRMYLIGNSGCADSVSDISIYFFDRKEFEKRIDNKLNGVYSLAITFEKMVPAKPLFELTKKNRWSWTDGERSYYRTLKVLDIAMPTPNQN